MGSGHNANIFVNPSLKQAQVCIAWTKREPFQNPQTFIEDENSNVLGSWGLIYDITYTFF